MAWQSWSCWTSLLTTPWMRRDWRAEWGAEYSRISFPNWRNPKWVKENMNTKNPTEQFISAKVDVFITSDRCPTWLLNFIKYNNLKVLKNIRRASNAVSVSSRRTSLSKLINWNMFSFSFAVFANSSISLKMWIMMKLIAIKIWANSI